MNAAKNKIDISDPAINKVRLGQILRAKRENADMTLRDACRVLGYNYTNFLSMIEKGNTNIPLARISDFANAYNLDAIFAAIVIKFVYPSTWDAMKLALGGSRKLLKDPKEIDNLDNSVDKAFKELLVSLEVE